MIGLSRPTLAILSEDYPKVKAIESKQEINGLLNFLITILNIKVSSEEEKLQLDKQMILIFDLIKTKFGTLTVPEIQEAFKMFIAKEFPELKVFRMLDCIVVADVLNAYRDFRNESLRAYDEKKKTLLEMPKEKTAEEIKTIRLEFLESIFEDLKTNGFSNDAWMLFEELETPEKINLTKQEKKELYAKQVQIHLVETVQETAAKNFHSAKFVTDDIRNKIQKGTVITSVANKCKSIAVSNYLKEYLTDFEEFKKQIEA